MSVTLADGVVLTVEIGFSTSAGANTVPINSTLASITWTDVSADVRSCSIKRGRSSELDSFNTGSCQIVFANADRKYDPEYASGTYYGKLTPGRPIRVKATPPSGAATGIFFGFVDQWNQQYNYPNDATAVVTASDAFKVMNLITLPSIWEGQVRADGPTSWFRFDDGVTPTLAFDTIKGVSSGTWAQYYGYTPAGQSATSLVYGDTTLSANFDGLNWVDLGSAPLQHAYGSSQNSIEFWMRSSTTSAGDFAILGGGRGYGVGMTVDGAGKGVIRCFWNDIVLGIYPTMTTTTTQVNDGKPHHVVMVFDSTATPSALRGVYVDGTYFGAAYETYPTYVADYFYDAYKVGWIFSPFTTASANFTSGFKGVIDELAFYQGKALSSSQVAAHYAIGKGTYLTGQTASARISSLLSLVGWMSDGSNISTATSTVQAIQTDNKTLLAALKECEAADQGRLFIDGSGKVAYISRNALATTAGYKDSQRTFGDSTGELPFTDIEFVYNDQLVRNRIIAGRENGATYVANDTTSQGQYFIRTDSLSGLTNDTDVQIADIANVRLATYKQPAMRIQSLGVNPRANTTIYTGLIGDEIGTRITVNRRPQGVGSVISKHLLIEGVSHEIGPRTWSATYNLSPAPLPFFVLNDATYGVLDSNYLGY